MLNPSSVKQLNDLENLFGFTLTWIFEKFMLEPARIRALFTGNQLGKTASVSYEYVLRILGIHPVPKRNVEYMECANRMAAKLSDDQDWAKQHRGWDTPTWLVGQNPAICPYCDAEVIRHKRRTTTFRFGSETLPGQSANTGDAGESAETKNTQYPALKLWLPHFLIKKDITARNPSMIIENILGDKDIIIEFISFNQDVQATAGTQRLSYWGDEETPKELWDEQLPRLLAEDGDLVVTLTPANFVSWMHDEIYEKAKIIYRTDAVRNFLTDHSGTPEKIEKIPAGEDIAIFQAASDDNPTLSPSTIEALFSGIDDPDVLAIRRYGIFKQISGRIFKDFEYNIHVIDEEKYFEDGVPKNWTWARGIDYHPRTPFGFAQAVLSPGNEAFVVLDWEPSPEKLTRKEISREIADLGGDINFRVNLIDPLSDATIQDNKKSWLDNFNDDFFQMKREDNLPSAYWRKWDTKGEVGRDAIRERLKNAKQCERPFNNKVLKDGREVLLPTIWILSRARTVAKSLKHWRWAEYSDAKSRQTKGGKNEPEQKYSHHCMVLEAIFKESSFKPPVLRKIEHRPPPRYFTGNRHERRRQMGINS